MDASELTVRGADWSFTHCNAGKHLFRLEISGVLRMTAGRISCGKFSEKSALTRRKVHCSGDELAVEIETAGQIPFGCEYLVERKLTLCDGLASSVCDLNAVNGGRLDGVGLEELAFPAWQSARFLVGSDPVWRSIAAAEKEFYSGTEPVTALSVVFADGVRAEYCVGMDLWRHRTGSTTCGASAGFALESCDGVLTLTRRVLEFSPEAEIEKRPRRFKQLFAWCSAASRPEVTAAAELKADWTCAEAATAQRTMRRAIRRAPGALIISGAAPGFCTDPAHLERSGKGERLHCDLEEYVSTYLWGNRQLQRHGGALGVRIADGPFAATAAAQNLRRAPCKITINEGGSCQ